MKVALAGRLRWLVEQVGPSRAGALLRHVELARQIARIYFSAPQCSRGCGLRVGAAEPFLLAPHPCAAMIGEHPMEVWLTRCEPQRRGLSATGASFSAAHHLC